MKVKASEKLAPFAIAAIIVIAIGAIFAPGTATIVQGWISPITNLNGVTVEANSPHAFFVEQYNNEDYYKVLVYMTPQEDVGEKINPVNIYGYYWHQKEHNLAVYSLWIPNLPTGKYDMVVSIHGRAWVQLSDGSEGPYGPWMEYNKKEYQDIVVLNNNNYMLGSVNTDNEVALNEVRAIGEEKLNSAQKAVLKRTLQEEVAQKGGKI